MSVKYARRAPERFKSTVSLPVTEQLNVRKRAHNKAKYNMLTPSVS